MSQTKRKLSRATTQGRPAHLPGTRALGVKVRRTDELVSKVQAGFGFEHLRQLEKQSGLTRKQIAQFVAITPATLARRESENQLTPSESDRLMRAARVFEMARDLFEGNVVEARQWLQTSNPALGGASPMEFTSTEVGAREVENLIGRLEHGIIT